MLALAEDCIRNFSGKFIGKTMPVLFEQKEKNLWSGLTDNYIRVYVENEEDLTNEIREVKLAEILGEGVRGEKFKIFPSP
jgi:threonylcarbamoyladenosine tRNA methylthiotransferase MtaB